MCNCADELYRINGQVIVLYAESVRVLITKHEPFQCVIYFIFISSYQCIYK